MTVSKTYKLVITIHGPTAEDVDHDIRAWAKIHYEGKINESQFLITAVERVNYDPTHSEGS
jgi:hypothetical protein